MIETIQREKAVQSCLTARGSVSGDFRAPVSSVVLMAVLSVACTGDRPESPATIPRARVALATPSQTTSFALYAQNSAALRDRATVSGGDVGVQLAGSGPFLTAGFELSLSSAAGVDLARTTTANRLQLLDRAHVGDIQVNQVTNQNGSYAHKNPFPSSMPALPPLAAVSPGTLALTVNPSTTVVGDPGAYGAVKIGYRGIWRLHGGVYRLSSLQLDNEARIEALAPVQIRIAGRVSALDRDFIGPASGTTLAAGDVRIEVSGRNGASGSLADSPKSAGFGNDSKITALLLVPSGTLQIGQRAVMTGACMARDVSVDIDSRLTYQSGIGPSPCLQSCDDGVATTIDTCDVGTCVHTPVPPSGYCASVTAGFCDDFDDGEAVNPRWDVGDEATSTDFAVVVDGGFVYRQGNSSTAARRTATVAGTWTDVVAQARFKILDAKDANNYVGLFARYDATANTGYFFGIKPGVGPAGTAAVSIRRKAADDGGSSLTPTWPNQNVDQQVQLAIGDWNTLRFVASGPVLAGYLNGTRVIETSDVQYTNGRIGVGSTGGATFEVDDVTVNENAASTQAFIDSRYTDADVTHVFSTKFGETIDCVDFFALPILKVLAARGMPVTTLPAPPTQDPGEITPSDIMFNGQPDSAGRPRVCPPGSVPLKRVTADDIAAFGGLDGYLRSRTQKAPPPVVDPPMPPACPSGSSDLHGYGHVTRTFTLPGHPPDMFPMPLVEFHDTMSIHAPTTQGSNGHSLAQIWVSNGGGFNIQGCTCSPGECFQVLEAGWTVDAYLFYNDHPTVPHLFNFATNDGYATGCYDDDPGPWNSTCQIWMPLPGAKYTLGMMLDPSGTTPNELEVTISYRSNYSIPLPGWVLRVSVNGNWSDIGYWPGAFFDGQFLIGNATSFQLGGEVYDPNRESDPSGPWGMMGNGVSPLTNQDGAAYHKHFCGCNSNQCQPQCLAPGITRSTVPAAYGFVGSPPATSDPYLYYGSL